MNKHALAVVFVQAINSGKLSPEKIADLKEKAFRAGLDLAAVPGYKP